MQIKTLHDYFHGEFKMTEITNAYSSESSSATSASISASVSFSIS